MTPPEISDVDGIADVLFGLTLIAHEKHGGKIGDVDACAAPWCVRGREARRMLRTASGTTCGHREWRNGRCAVMTCPNYTMKHREEPRDA